MIFEIDSMNTNFEKGSIGFLERPTPDGTPANFSKSIPTSVSPEQGEKNPLCAPQGPEKIRTNLAYPETAGALTISQLSLYLKQHIEKDFSQVRVQGEISGCKRHLSGHTYFSLKDENSVLDAICWRSTPVKIPLQDGGMVLCSGRITTYGARSKYQLIVEKVESAGQGQLLLQIERLKEALTKEGIFSPEKKLPIPKIPRCIGIITSPTGAVIQDMMIRFQQRLSCRLVLYPVSVQGVNTVPDILEALHYFHEMAPRPDVLIIARGGGSVEDLWPFHSEALVRAVAKSSIPVISAIGHESDTTLLDYAASFRAPTPTAAAEHALPLCSDLVIHVSGLMGRLTRLLIYHRDMGMAALNHLCHRLEKLRNFPQILGQRLDEGWEKMQRTLEYFLTNKKQLAQRIFPRFHRGLFQRWIAHEASLLVQGTRLQKGVLNTLGREKEKLASLGKILEVLSHQRTLERGFAMVLDSHSRICSKAEAAQKEPLLSIRFCDGMVLATAQT